MRKYFYGPEDADFVYEWNNGFKIVYHPNFQLSIIETGNQPKNFFKIGMPTYSGTPLFLQKHHRYLKTVKKYVIPIRNKYLFDELSNPKISTFYINGKTTLLYGFMDVH